MLLLLVASRAVAGPLAVLDQDIDGDGKPEHVTVEATGDLMIQGQKIYLRPNPAYARLVARAPYVAVTIGSAPATNEQTIVFEKKAQWTELLRAPTGPVPPDGDYAIAIAPGPNGIYRYQQRAGIRRCDGRPAYLFAEGWTGKKFQRLSKLPIDVDAATPIVVAHADKEPAPAPLVYQARAASYEVGAQNALELALPAELEDGKPATTWHEELSTIGEGQFFTFEPRATAARAAQLRIVGAKGTLHAKRVAVVTAHEAWHVDLADTEAPQVFDLPKPIEGCVSVVIESAYGTGQLAFGEMSVYGEGERNGGGEASLAKVIADGGDVSAATQALARRGAAATAALDAELQKASGIAARTRLVRALAQMPDPSAGPLLAHAIAKNQVEGESLDEVLGSLGTLGFAAELRGIVGQVPAGHRAAATHALTSALQKHAPFDPALLIELAGTGDRDQRRATIDGLALARAQLLVEAARTASSPEAAGDLWRAAIRTHDPSVLPALIAALPTASDYERRSRLAAGIAELGDRAALDQLTAWLTTLPDDGARAAYGQVIASAIAKAPRPDALPLLLAILKEHEAGARHAALTALGATEAGPPGPWHTASSSTEIDHVIQTELAADLWPEVRARAAQMLGARCTRTGPARSLDDALHRDPDLAVRNEALSALVECRAQGVAEVLAKTWDNKKQPLSLRQLAIDLTAQLEDRGLAQKLVEKFEQWRGAALESEDALALAQNAAYAIGRLNAPGAGEVLLAALADSSFPELVAASATGLGLMGAQCPATARPKLRELAHSDDPQVQVAASRASSLCEGGTHHPH